MNEARKKERKKQMAAVCLGCLLALPFLSGGAQAACVGEVKELVPVGQAVGVKLFADGVLVVDFPEGVSSAKACGLKEGDMILAWNGTQINSTEHLQQLLAENGDAQATLSVQRGNKTITLTAVPRAGEDGTYRLGAFVRDSMAGIGTMTFYDPQSGVFGALGHGVTDVDTGKLMPLDQGSTMEASVKAVKRGESGSPGELRGEFDLTRDSGTLYANTDCGIFGVADAENFACLTRGALPVAEKSEVKTGKATILSNVSGTEVKEYEIKIEKVFATSADTRNLLLRVTDEELLEKTGGIVQGMSGSPILQNGKIVGAVTHVLVDDAAKGYGILIENMLDAAELSTPRKAG